MKNKFLIFLLAISMVSCTSTAYIPKVSLDISPKTINKSVQIDRFKDSSPPEDKMIPFMGSSITSRELLPGELDLEVTNAVVADFSANGLFKQVGRRVENPDFVIKGEIKKFCGKYQFNNFAKFASIAGVVGATTIFFVRWAWLLCLPSVAWYFGVPISTNTSEVVIEMKLYDNEDNLINTYTGKAIDFTSASMYKNQLLQVPTMTNKTFSKAIQQIRNQILADIEING